MRQGIEPAGEHHIRVFCECGWSELVKGNFAFPRDLRKAQRVAEKHNKKVHRG